jgi:hypothetical protein
MPATSQEPSGRFASRSEFQTGGSGRRKRVSARHQVKRLHRTFDRACSFRKPARQKKRVFFIGADPKVRNFIGALSQLRFGPDVFADALVPSRRVVVARGSYPEHLKTPVSPPQGLVPGNHCGNGYRFAKRQGKLNSPNPTAVQQNKRFCDLAKCGARIRSDSIHREP